MMSRAHFKAGQALAPRGSYRPSHRPTATAGRASGAPCVPAEGGENGRRQQRFMPPPVWVGAGCGSKVRVWGAVAVTQRQPEVCEKPSIPGLWRQLCEERLADAFEPRWCEPFFECGQCGVRLAETSQDEPDVDRRDVTRRALTRHCIEDLPCLSGEPVRRTHTPDWLR
jgi:hypothetical protein